MVGIITNPVPEASDDQANQGYLQESREENGGVLGAAAQLFSTTKFIENATTRSATTDYDLGDPFGFTVPYHGSLEKNPQNPQPLPKMDAEQINKSYGPIGFDGKQVKLTNEPVPDVVGQMLGKQKQDELNAQDTWNRFSSHNNAVTNFGAGIVGFMMDPTNAATLFIPPVGEEAILGGIARAGLATDNVAARTGARLIAGGATGTAAQAPLTGIKYAASSPEGYDYSARDALNDMLYSAAGNAIVHGGFLGGAREAGILKPDELIKNAREGKVPPTEPPSSGASQMTTQHVYSEGEKLPPVVDAIVNADAPTKHAAISAATAQIIDGRPVDTSGIFPQDKLPDSNPSHYKGANPDHVKAAIEEIKTEAAEKSQPQTTTVQVYNEEPKLPRNLAGTKPRYKGETPQFESDIDKALYIVGNEVKKSTSDAKYREFLAKHGYDDAAIAAGSKQIRRHVKNVAESAEPGTLKIETQNKTRPTEQPTPPKVYSKVTEQGIDKDELRSHMRNKDVRLREDTNTIYEKLTKESSPATNPTVAEIAQKQEQLYSEGFAPNMTSDELSKAMDEVFPPKEGAEPSDETPIPKPKIEEPTGDYQSFVVNEAKKFGIELDKDTIANVEKVAKGTEEGESTTEPTEPKPEGETPTETEPEQIVKPSIHDAEIAELESKIDRTKLTDEENGLINEANKKVEESTSLYQQKLKDLADCLVGASNDIL